MKISQSNIRNMLRAISDGNHVLNETVRLYQSTKTDCSNCGYDPIRKESTNLNCPTCGGSGSIVTETFKEVPSSIETYDDLKYDFTQAGILLKGQIHCTIDMLEINTVLNVDKKFTLADLDSIEKFIQQYDYITWKGAKYTVESFEPGWLQGNLYEIALVLSLRGAKGAN